MPSFSNKRYKGILGQVKTYYKTFLSNIFKLCTDTIFISFRPVISNGVAA